MASGVAYGVTTAIKGAASATDDVVKGAVDKADDVAKNVADKADDVAKLEGSLKNPNLSSADRALLEKGLKKTVYYINKIKDLFGPFGGI